MKDKFSRIVLNEVLMESMPGIAYIFTKDGRLASWGSSAAWKILEYTDEEIKNKFVMEFIDDADKERVMTAFQEVFKTGFVQIEHLAVAKSGKRIPLLARATPAVIDGEEYLVGLSIDISELVSARERIKGQVEEISKLNELLKTENIYLKDQLEITGQWHEMIGESESLQYVQYKIKQVAPTDAAVFIEGETGTGKELVARAIHKESRRKNKPFIKVNCASIPENLIESELFGHEKGAFTGAVERRIGRFEIANGGTIFLDEIGELPMNVQPKLLHILQQGEFERIGSSKTIKTDVRVISATNKVLEDEIKKGQFRTDLYYRLNVFPISVSPLRDRKPDILPIAEYYNKIYSEKFKKPLKSFSTMSKKQLMNYSWPGNIRELENVIERAVITSDSSDLEVEALSDTNNILDEELPLGELEKNYIIQMLEKANWKVSGTNGAASRLKIHPETLRSKMRKLGINRKNQL